MMPSNHEISTAHKIDVRNEGAAVSENECVSLKSLSSQQKKIQRQFQEYYDALFISEQPVEKKLQELLALSKQIEELLTLLIVQKKEEILLVEYTKQVANLLEAFQKNEQLLMGRAYFLELIDAHKDDFDVLLQHCSPQHNELLQGYINQQNKRDLFAKTTQIVSTIGWGPIVAYRFLIPTTEQKKINQWLPKTIDAQVKQLTIQCAIQALAMLKNKLHVMNIKQEPLFQRVSFNNPILKQLLCNESPQGLTLLRQLNKVSQSYAELAPYVNKQSPARSSVLLQTQALLLQPYVQLISKNDEEVEVVALLIARMRMSEDSLNSLTLLKKKQSTVCESKQVLDTLVHVFNEYTSNLYVATIAQEQINRLSLEAYELEKKINALTLHIAQNDEQLHAYLAQISYDELGELKNAYCLPKTLENALLSLITVLPLEQQVITSEYTLSDFIYKYYYLNLINDETKEQEELIVLLERNGITLEKKLNYLLEARKAYDDCAVNVQKNKNILNILEHAQVGSILINLIKERLIYCERQFTHAAFKRGRIINDLALGDALFQQLLTQEPLERIAHALLEHQEIKACVTHYKILIDKINVRLELMHATHTLDQYIKERDTWWVQLTDFFAQFCFLLKTNVSRKIDKAKILKKELQLAIIQCETHIQKDIEVVKTNKLIGRGLLDDLVIHHTYSHEEQKPFDIDKTFNLLSQALFFSPEKQRLAQKPDISYPITTVKRI